MSDYVFGPRLRLVAQEIELKYVRSSGKGGQHVNKTSSKAQLSWAIYMNQTLPRDVLVRFAERFQSKIDSHGILHLSSDEYREQSRNAEACLDRLKQMLVSVQYPPKPRIATKPKASAKAKRLQTKKQRGRNKELRKKVSKWDE